MTSWTPPKTWTADSSLTAAELNEQVRDNGKNTDERLTLHGITSESAIQYVKTARDGVSASLSSTINVSDANDVKIQFAGSDEEWDDSAYHSDSNPAEFVAARGGTFDCDLWVSFEANSSGRREAWFEVVDTTQYNRVRLPATSGSRCNFSTSCKITLTDGQYVKCWVKQTSGGALNLQARFQMHRISE